MIIHLKKGIPEMKVAELMVTSQAVHLKKDEVSILVTSSGMKELPFDLEPYTDSFFVSPTDIQLASNEYEKSKKEIAIGNLTIGGLTNHTLMIAGPCAVESWEQIEEVATYLKELGVQVLRAGCFKPRTSPYTFQGLGAIGLEMLVKIRALTGMKIITEVKDGSHFDLVAEHADIIQVGAKAMYDTSVLKACGKSSKPILLKRGFGSSLQEFVQSAEFILSGGNPQVILCERGIRTFETKTRFTLDLCGVSYLKEYINLPIVVDPSHALGFRYGIGDLSRATMAMGVDGLILETHPDPAHALSDAAQQLSLNSFRELYHSLKPVASAVGRTMI